ncbi:hypothetical protein HD806DRAFT_540821 [Xylariaceae sp. AK1471]|nr:hypothetical protein HD806DRAFT_540821 [Xylariaceae sp. AK1471]
MPHEDAQRWVPLNAWNQLGPRAYTRMVLCFEFNNDEEAAAVAHLRSCVAKLSQKRPLLKSLLKANEPIALINTTCHQNIPVEVHDIKEEFGHNYEYLKDETFPASAFINKVFDVPVGVIAHALIIRIYIIDSGLILGIHLHHSLGDGHCVDDIISWLSAETRGDDDAYQTKHVTISNPFCEAQYSPEGNSEGHLITPEYVSQRFPERILLSRSPPSPPTEGYVGKIFTFDLAELNNDQNLYQNLGNIGRPSTNVLIAACVWAHVTKARLAASLGLNGDTLTYGECDSKPSRLFTIVDFRKRVFTEEYADQYFGNAVDAVIASIPTTSLLEACKGSSLERLEPIVLRIQESIKSVDKAFVTERYKFHTRLSNPQKLPYDHFPTDKRAFMFNSWRYNGTKKDQKWNIPGVLGEGYPDRARRAGGYWNLPAAMIMPTPPGSQEVEVMVTIEERAIDLLLKDQEFRKVVCKVID